MTRGLRMLRTFEGRDSRQQFWIYAAGVFVVTTGVSFVLNVGVVAIGFLLGPDAILSFLPSVVLILTVVVAAATIALYAAAVTRRLHDRGLRGWWGLLPVVLLVVGMGTMGVLFTSVDATTEPPVALFFTSFAINILYFVALGVLIVQLALPGRPVPASAADAG